MANLKTQADLTKTVEQLVLLMEAQATKAKSNICMDKSWHLDKKTPQTMIIALLVMFVGGIQSTTTAFAEIKSNNASIASINADIITRESVYQLIQIQDIKMGAVADTITELKIQQKEFKKDLKDVAYGISEIKTLLIKLQQHN